MIRPIVKDPIALMRPSSEVTLADRALIKDMKDTLLAHRHECVGMAANMIGSNKRMIIVHTESGEDKILINPVLRKKNGKYDAEEGCLSLTGVRPAVRYRVIEVEYEDESFRKRTEKFTGFTAQIVQHEIDHLEGILI